MSRSESPRSRFVADPRIKVAWSDEFVPPYERVLEHEFQTMSFEYDFKTIDEVDFQGPNSEKRKIRAALTDFEQEAIRIMKIIDWLRSELHEADNDDNHRSAN